MRLPTPKQARARQRNWYLFQLGGMKGTLGGMGKGPYLLTVNERTLLSQAVQALNRLEDEVRKGGGPTPT